VPLGEDRELKVEHRGCFLEKRPGSQDQSVRRPQFGSVGSIDSDLADSPARRVDRCQSPGEDFDTGGPGPLEQ
jgi:hypothetical protein